MTEPTTASDPRSTGRLWAIMVTFRRPDACAQMLEILSNQGLDLQRLIVVDNDSDEEVRRSVEQVNAIYLGMATNTGPAGGIAAGMEVFLEESSAGDWVMLVDDDNPPLSDTTIADTWRFAHECVAADRSTGAVGGTGARYSRREGVFERVEDVELNGRVVVDYIGSGQFPMYRRAAIAAVGLFDSDLFFGFDDADYGLRLRSRGFSLYVDGEQWRERRTKLGRMGKSAGFFRTDVTSSVWRSYYNTRNLVVIGRRHGSPFAPIYAGFGSAVKTTWSLIRARRTLREVGLPLRGLVDGLIGRRGRVVDPTSFSTVEGRSRPPAHPRRRAGS